MLGYAYSAVEEGDIWKVMKCVQDIQKKTGYKEIPNRV